MMQFPQAAAKVFSPMVAGGLVGLLGIAGVLLIDLTTFLFALFTLLLVRVPAPSGGTDVKGKRNSLLKDAAFGWTYITKRPGLLGLLTFFALNNFLTGLVIVLVIPLVLSFATAAVLGLVLAVSGGGLLFGSVVLSTWGGLRRRVRGILLLSILQAALLVAGGCTRRRR